MTPQQILNAVLAYREGNRLYARFDLQAALEHAPSCANCTHRFGNDPAALRAALALLG
jgi:hypothetical protein